MRIQIIESRSEIGAGTRGSSLGPQAIKTASLNTNTGKHFFDKHPTILVSNQNEILFKKPTQPRDTTLNGEKKNCAINIESQLKVFKDLQAPIVKAFKDQVYPIILAGDHSSAAATIAGIKEANPNKRLGVVWCDAHSDLHSPYTTPSGNIHGMPLAIALAEKNLKNQVNNLHPTTEKLWEELTNTSGHAPNIKHEDLVLLGVRSYEAPEDELIKTKPIKHITVTDTRVRGLDNTISEIFDHLSNCDLIYISFDVDAMDPTYTSKGTGTPVGLGFTEEEATKILTGLARSPKVCCLEITEVNPTLDDKCNTMAETAFRILRKLTTVILNK